MTRPDVVSIVVVSSNVPPEFVALAGLDAVEIVRVDEGTDGVVAARNDGARRATGEFVAFADAGFSTDLEALERALQVLHQPGVACVGVGESNEIHDTLFVAASGMVVDREVFEIVGGFDSSLTPELADLDFGWRLWWRGYRVRSFGCAAEVPADAPAAAGVDAEGARRVVLANAESVRGSGREPGRRRRDHELVDLFASTAGPPAVRAVRTAALEAAASLGVRALSSARRRVLVATGDVLEPKMAGPAIRAWQIARALSSEHDVELVSTERCSLEHDGFSTRFVDAAEFTRAVREADVIVFQGNLMALYPELRTTDRVVVADIYDPFHLEVLEQTRELPSRERRASVESSTNVLNEQLARADFLLCASDKQRDFWLGQLAAVGRINPATYDESENLDALIAVAPFGVGDDEPVHDRRVMKGVLPGIDTDDLVILWGGGVYNWFDPLTLLRAVDQLRHTVPRVRLVFLGLKHPNPHVGEMRMAVEMRKLAAELGLVDTHVFFNEDWVPYEQRQNFLLEADLGVSTHLDHVETAFSFRTRILDYLWAGLPVVATAGDSLAEQIAAAGAGFAVPAGDVDALERALAAVLTDPDRATAMQVASRELAEELRWARALEPLVEFCRAPRRAPDLVDPMVSGAPGEAPHGAVGRRLRRDLGIFYEYVRRRDLAGLLARVRARIGVMIRRR